MRRRTVLMGGVLSLVLAVPALAAPLAADKAGQVDAIAREVLAATGAPSASITIVEDGELAYAQAYGQARLSPLVPATLSTRYGIASVSKQFTAAAVLLLAEEASCRWTTRWASTCPA